MDATARLRKIAVITLAKCIWNLVVGMIPVKENNFNIEAFIFLCSGFTNIFFSTEYRTSWMFTNVYLIGSNSKQLLKIMVSKQIILNNNKPSTK